MDVDDVRLLGLHRLIYIRPTCPTPPLDRRGHAVMPASTGALPSRRREHADLVTLGHERLAQGPCVIGHASLQRRVFAGDEEDAEGGIRQTRARHTLLPASGQFSVDLIVRTEGEQQNLALACLWVFHQIEGMRSSESTGRVSARSPLSLWVRRPA